MPREVGQLPVYYNRKFPEGHDYVEVSRTPLYEFGYGLSYTRFAYDSLQVEVRGRDVTVSFDVRNVGSRDGEEVAQLYVTDLTASVVRPRKQLRAFERVAVPAGGSRRVEFTLGGEAFALCDRQLRRVVEPGAFRIAVGASSEDIRLEQIIELE